MKGEDKASGEGKPNSTAQEVPQKIKNQDRVSDME
jgi:hypothetical protein